MKDFILILIMCGAFTFFCAGLVYLRYWEIREKIEEAYKKGFEDGKEQNDIHKGRDNKPLE